MHINTHITKLISISDIHMPCFDSQGNCKRMVGSRDGSNKRVKMARITTLVDIGKQESRRSGMDVQIYLVNFR